MTAYGGSIWADENGSYGGPQWDKVPDDPTVYPWLARDVVGYDLLGARYRYKKGLFGYVVYTDGENLRDNGGHWDDIHANLTLGMLAAYHPWHALLLLALALAPLFVYYRVIVRPLWIRPLRAWIEDRRRRLREGVPGCPIGPA